MLKIFTKQAPKTVDGVLSAFQTAITDLHALADKHQGHSAEQEAIAAQVLKQKAAHDAEAARASSIATKMQAVFG